MNAVSEIMVQILFKIYLYTFYKLLKKYEILSITYLK